MKNRSNLEIFIQSLENSPEPYVSRMKAEIESRNIRLIMSPTASIVRAFHFIFHISDSYSSGFPCDLEDFVPLNIHLEKC